MNKLLKYKKEIIAVFVSLIILGVLIFFAGKKIGVADVKFETISEKSIPQKITSEILPQYRTLERAMACILEDKVYVIVTRGEKPTAGYDVAIRKIKLESKKEKTILKVYVDFSDPKNSENLPQIVTYPVSVAHAKINGLPDNIELISEYIE